jgi:hypothetical protein
VWREKRTVVVTGDSWGKGQGIFWSDGNVQHFTCSSAYTGAQLCKDSSMPVHFIVCNLDINKNSSWINDI